MWSRIASGFGDRLPSIVALVLCCLLVGSCDDPAGLLWRSYLPEQACCPTWLPGDSLLLYYDYGITDERGRGLWALSPESLVATPVYTGTMPARNPDISPVDDRIVFQSDAQIYSAGLVKNVLDESSVTLLTDNSKWNYFPAWSPDGTRIAYDNQDCGMAAEPPLPDSLCGIMIISGDGTERTYMTRGRMPSWAPDGSHLLYVSPGGEVSRIQVDEPSAPEVVTNFAQRLDGFGFTMHPRYDPAGMRIAVEVRAGRDIAIWLTNADGSSPSRLIGGRDPVWSSDGRYIAFVRFGDEDPRREFTIWRIDVVTRSATQLTFR